MNKYIFILSLAFISGCAFNQPRLNFKNEETTKQSLKEINKELDFIQQEKLKESLFLIVFKDIKSIDDLLKFKFDQKFYNKLKNEIDGKTYQEIVDVATKIAEKNISQLEKQKLKDIPNQDFINQFQVIDHEIYSNFETKILNVKIQNNSIEGLYAIQLYIKSNSPDKMIPDDEKIIPIQFNETLWGNNLKIIQIPMDKDFDDNLDFRILSVLGPKFNVQSNWNPEDENKLNFYKRFVKDNI